MAISISVSELYDIFENTPANQNILLVGNHGIGKSRIVEDFFSAKGMKVTALFLGQMSDPGDLIGLPRLNEETGKTDFMPPYWFPTDGEPIVLFLDELNRARPEMLQTVMDLVLNRKLAGRKLPEGSRIVSAVNAGQQYQVGELDPALVSRFNIYTLQPTAQDWLEWAKREELDERVINFIQANPGKLDSEFDASADSLDKSPDRRAWERVSQVMKGVKSPQTYHAKLVAGIIGALAASSLFESFKEKTVTGKDVLSKYDEVKSKLEELTVDAFPMLNDSIFENIESLSASKKKLTPAMTENLSKYLAWLCEERRESYAYFINAFLSGKYKQTISLIAKSNPELIIEFNNFIKKL